MFDDKPSFPMNERMEKFAEVFDELHRMVHTGKADDVFNNGADASQGLTLKGEQMYREMLTEAGLGPKDPDSVYKAPPPIPGWSHPKREFWTRPQGDS